MDSAEQREVSEGETLFIGLFQRLHDSGLHPVVAGELASANYPSDEHLPLQAVRVRRDAVHWHTERYLDRGALTLDELWLAIWGVDPYTYFDVASDSPAARAFGLVETHSSSGRAESGETNQPGMGPLEVAQDIKSPWGPPAVTARHDPHHQVDQARPLADHFMLSSLDPRLARIRAFSGEALPAGVDRASRDLADLACIAATLMVWGVADYRKSFAGFSRRTPDGWIECLCDISVATAAALISTEADCDLLARDPTCDHFTRLLAQTHSDLPDLIEKCEQGAERDLAALFARASRVLSEVSSRLRVNLKEDLLHMAAVGLPSVYFGAKSALDRPLLRDEPIFRDEVSKLPKRAHCTDGATAQSTEVGAFAPEQGARGPTQTSPQRSQSPLIGRTANQADNEHWLQACKNVADLREVPWSLVEHLVPLERDRNWTTKDSDQFQAILETSWPGRSAWLAREGVTHSDKVAWDSTPFWVQGVLEGIFNRTAELEATGHVAEGSDLVEQIVAYFQPQYAVCTALPEDQDSPLPYELLYRVEPYWAKVMMAQRTDPADFDREMISLGTRTANARIRVDIRAARL